MNLDESPDPIEQLNRTFQFAGTALNRFSITHRHAFFRVGTGEPADSENAKLLLFLLTKDAKTADAIRTDEQKAAFRLAADEWAEKHLFHMEQIKDGYRVYDELWRDVNLAKSLTTDSTGVGNA